MKRRTQLNNFLSLMIVMLAVLLLSGCGPSANGASPYEGKNASDVSQYEGMEGVTDVMFVDTTVKEIERAMKNKGTFAFIATYADCPYCNKLMPHLNEAAKRAGVKVGLLNTRKDPRWQNNTEIDDYDVFCELFGEYLKEDPDGTPHLYTPDVYFIKDGEVAGNHSGVVEGADDADADLTEEQTERLSNELDNEFRSLK